MKKLFSAHQVLKRGITFTFTKYCDPKVSVHACFKNNPSIIYLSLNFTGGGGQGRNEINYTSDHVSLKYRLGSCQVERDLLEATRQSVTHVCTRTYNASGAHEKRARI